LSCCICRLKVTLLRVDPLLLGVPKIPGKAVVTMRAMKSVRPSRRAGWSAGAARAGTTVVRSYSLVSLTLNPSDGRSLFLEGIPTAICLNFSLLGWIHLMQDAISLMADLPSERARYLWVRLIADCHAPAYWITLPELLQLIQVSFEGATLDKATSFGDLGVEASGQAADLFVRRSISAQAWQRRAMSALLSD
jgi:hypothetical protein